MSVIALGITTLGAASTSGRVTATVMERDYLLAGDMERDEVQLAPAEATSHNWRYGVARSAQARSVTAAGSSTSYDRSADVATQRTTRSLGGSQGYVLGSSRAAADVVGSRALAAHRAAPALVSLALGFSAQADSQLGTSASDKSNIPSGRSEKADSSAERASVVPGGLRELALRLIDPAKRASADSCKRIRHAVLWYTRVYRDLRARVGAGNAGLSVQRNPSTCPRYHLRVLKRKAHAARLAYERWHVYNYAWRDWMPAKHQRVARCETGYQGGTGPGGSRWDWDSGTYVSAFGIYRPGYDDDAHRVGNLGWDETIRELGRVPTPREQMQAVDSHRAVHGGWSGWGCRNA